MSRERAIEAMPAPGKDDTPPVGQGSAGEVFAAFLKLGLTAFGGPIAHLGYFRDEFVTRRRWLTEAAYADLVALCQFLPGPASSQVGFAIGLMRGGGLGGLAAWTAFTLPSALILVAFAYGAASFAEGPGAILVHGLKLVAVAVIAQAVFGMARSLTPDRTRATIAVLAILVVALAPVALGQIAAIVLGAAAGLLVCRDGMATEPGHLAVPVPRSVSVAAFAIFLALLIAALVPAGSASPALSLPAAFYRAGALVFGGGHVVLPLLQAATVAPGFVTADTFLAGYGAAQAVPGPLFTFGAYLGAVSSVGPGLGPGGVVGAAIGLAAIFLPGLLLVVAALPFWGAIRRRTGVQAALRGTNAAVVGILAAALYDPVFTSSVRSGADFAIAAAGFVALTAWKRPPWQVVAAMVLGAAVLGLSRSA